uniref:Uncharacterized protein n=1 Tax=Trichogramma kaykai TaxID=54128 RepID=A0ABD2WLY6_9HYME
MISNYSAYFSSVVSLFSTAYRAGHQTQPFRDKHPFIFPFAMEVTLTEYEENLCFDLDDPDFAPICSRSTSHGVFRGVSFGGGMSINVKKCECFRQVYC